MLLVGKIIFLIIAVVYSFTCFGRLIGKQDISFGKVFAMAVGIAGFLALQGWL